MVGPFVCVRLRRRRRRVGRSAKEDLDEGEEEGEERGRRRPTGGPSPASIIIIVSELDLLLLLVLPSSSVRLQQNRIVKLQFQFLSLARQNHNSEPVMDSFENARWLMDFPLLRKCIDPWGRC